MSPEDESPHPERESREQSAYPRAVERFAEQIDQAEWEAIIRTLDGDEPPAFAEWNLDPERPFAEILRSLAAIRVSVPSDNPENLKETHNRTIENHLKLALAVAGSRENLSAFLELVRARLESRPGEAQRRLAKQTMWVWAPAAEVVGLHEQKTALEEAMFPILYPAESGLIGRAYKDLREDGAARARLEHCRTELREELETNPALGQLGRYTVEVSARQKTDYSVWQKCRKKGLEEFRLPDFIGLRAIISIDADAREIDPVAYCYAAEGVITDECGYASDRSRRKDYIARPKPNGYRSLHLTVTPPGAVTPLEIQIRTAEMHRQAEEDHDASHIAYDVAEKHVPGTYEFSDGSKPKGISRWRDAVAGMIREGRTDGWEDIRDGRILLFTPDGNLHEASPGSTVLDGSFEIDSNRALRTQEIRINGKQVALDEPLRFGDCIDVTYAAEPCWRPDWNTRVNTRRSRKALRTAWKRTEAGRLRTSAVERIGEFCRHEWGLEDPLAALTEADRRDLARRYSAPDFERALIGIGARDPMGKGNGEVQERGIGRITERIRRNLGLPMPKGPSS